MRPSDRSYRTLALGLLVSLIAPALAWAQAPTAENQPRLAAPARGAVIQQPAPAAPAVADQPPGQPTTQEVPPSQVIGPPAGVTQVPASGGSASSSSQAATGSSGRSYSTSKFALALDGLNAGWVNGLEGGTPAAEVVVEKAGPDQVAHKHVARVRYEPLSFDAGLDSKTLMKWIAATWAGKGARKNGSVIGADYSNKAVNEREFFNAMITAVTMPALDASSKDAASIGVSIAPEYTRLKSGSGATVGGGGYDSKTQKRWLPSNFRFEMAGLDGNKVNRIESFTVSNKVSEDAVGEMRDYQKEPGQLDFPNLKLSLAESQSQTWNDWLEDFVVKGNNSNDKERNGAIIYLDPTKQTELGRVNLFSCGIVGVAPKRMEARSEGGRRVEAELYCERMELATP